DLRDGGLQLLRQPFAVLLRRFGFAAVAIFVAGRDPRDVDEEGSELPAAPLVAAHRKRPQRVAVIALAAADEDAALGLADFDEVLPRHLERCFHRLGTAGDEIDVTDAL